MIPLEMTATAEAVFAALDPKADAWVRQAALMKALREPEFTVHLMASMLTDLGARYDRDKGAGSASALLRESVFDGTRDSAPFGPSGNGADPEPAARAGDVRRLASGQLVEFVEGMGWVAVPEPPAQALQTMLPSGDDPFSVQREASTADPELVAAGTALADAVKSVEWQRVGSDAPPAPGIQQVADAALAARRARRDEEATAMMTGPLCGVATSNGPCTLRADHPIGPAFPGENGHMA
jgi:hypothetical protein